MNKIKHWLEPDWPAPTNIHAATTLRTGGVSQAPFSSLNPAAHVGDDTDRVRQNRQILREMLDLPSEPVWLDQIHSNCVVKAENPPCPPLQKGGMPLTKLTPMGFPRHDKHERRFLTSFRRSPESRGPLQNPAFDS